MDLSHDESLQQIRDRARAWLAEHTPGGLPDPTTPDGFTLHREWEQLLHRDGWTGLTWPTQYGGQDMTIWEWLVFEEEYYRAGGPTRITQNGASLLAPSLLAFGTEEQKQTLLPRIASAKDIWAQGWSEPGAGSDLASVRSRAVRAGNEEGWLLSGHKTWSTRAGISTHLFGLFRTDPDSERHKGLTYFLVDLSAPGVEVRPFSRFDGQEDFAEVFLDQVFVPDSDVLGGVGEGWRVAMSTTDSERGATLRSPARFNQAVTDLAAEIDEADEAARDEVAALAIRARVYEGYTLHEATRALRSGTTQGSASISKLLWSELDIDIHQAATRLVGESPLTRNRWTDGLMFSLSGPIYAGTNEIQRTIIAERVLGLPRGRGRK